jgi:hypothetical protein
MDKLEISGQQQQQIGSIVAAIVAASQIGSDADLASTSKMPQAILPKNTVGSIDKFCAAPGQSARVWCEDFQRLNDANDGYWGTKPETQKEILRQSLGRAARTWYDTTKFSAKATNKDILKQLLETFREDGSQQDCMARLLGMRQKPDETTTQFGFRIKEQCRGLGAEIPVESQIQAFIAGIHQQYRRVMLKSEPKTMQEAIKAAAAKERLDKSCSNMAERNGNPIYQIQQVKDKPPQLK